MMPSYAPSKKRLQFPACAGIFDMPIMPKLMVAYSGWPYRQHLLAAAVSGAARPVLNDDVRQRQVRRARL
jgi:hypothetical protein